MFIVMIGTFAQTALKATPFCIVLKKSIHTLLKTIITVICGIFLKIMLWKKQQERKTGG